jgi:hypothetical protein
LHHYFRALLRKNVTLPAAQVHRATAGRRALLELPPRPRRNLQKRDAVSLSTERDIAKAEIVKAMVWRGFEIKHRF